MKIRKLFLLTMLLMTFNFGFSQDTLLFSAFKKSEQLESKDDYKTAIGVMKGVYDTSSYEINLRLGWLNYLAKQNTESVSYFKRAIDLKPNSVEARLFFVEPADILGNVNDIVAQYSKVIEINPQNSTANYWLGMVYYNKKDYQGAIKYFEKILSLYPFDYSSLVMEAWTKYQLGSIAESRILFEKVLALYPNDKSAGQGLNQINDPPSVDFTKEQVIATTFNQSEDKESKKDYTSAIELMTRIYDKTSYEINIRLGWLYYENAQYAEAQSYYKAAIGIMPNSIEPREGYAFVLNALSNTDELINQYNKILEIDPQNFGANYWLGMVYYNKKNYKNAQPYFDKIVSLYPFNYDALIMDSWTKFDLGKGADAKNLFKMVQLLTPNDEQVGNMLNQLTVSIK